MSDTATKPKTIRCTDEVLREIWRIKDELSAARGNSVEKLFAEARQRQKNGGHRVVDLSDVRESRADTRAE